LTDLVVDASVALSWVLPDEFESAAERLFERAVMSRLHVPAHFYAEVGNVLLQSHKRGRILIEDLEEARRALRRLQWVTVDLDRDVIWTRAMTRAHDRGLTLYDGLYLDLAIARDLPLATFDRGLRRAAEAEGVALA